MKAQELLAWLNLDVSPRPAWPGYLPVGSYAAWLEGAPFRDDLGLTGEDIDTRTLVIGVLEISP